MIRRLVAIVVVFLVVVALVAVLYVERSGSGPPVESRADPEPSVGAAFGIMSSSVPGRRPG